MTGSVNTLYVIMKNLMVEKKSQVPCIDKTGNMLRDDRERDQMPRMAKLNEEVVSEVENKTNTTMLPVIDKTGDTFHTSTTS